MINAQRFTFSRVAIYATLILAAAVYLVPLGYRHKSQLVGQALTN